MNLWRAVRLRSLIPLLLGVAVPLYVFAALAEDVRENEGFWIDQALLPFLHRHSSPNLDALMLFASRVGYVWGVVPVTVGVVLLLVRRRAFRQAVAFGIAMAGTYVISWTVKLALGRERPDFWVSIAPESTFAFPSGHAMASAGLAIALTLLMWRTPFRWPVAVAGAVFALLVGISRMYLGVHFPSDVAAGWAASLAWVTGVWLTVRPNPPGPRD